MASDSLDANIILRLIEGDNPAQRKKAIKFLEQPGPVHHIGDLALSESIYVLESVYGYTREQAIDRINFFLTHYSSVIRYSRHLTSYVFPFYLAHPKLSFNDCCLAFYAHEHQAEPLYTFDQKLAQQSPYAKELK